MDMKKILQAIDSGSSKPVEGSNDMSKFMSIVTEGANPHKVALPVQMAMQHYSKPVTKKPVRENIVQKYFHAVEEEHAQEQLQEKQNKRALINQYASIIAERVRLKENFNPNMSPNPGFAPGPGGPGIQSSVAEEHNEPDAVTLDIPLLIRLFEYAREDAKTDMDLHNVTERLIRMSEEGRTLTMDDYDAICRPDVQESAPPGAKAERMVKHIKSNYAKDGKLTDKEKSIAYATAWKAHNKK